MDILDKVAMVAGIVLPLFNIPLVVRMIKRKSSADISLVWAVGVWACLASILPAAARSEEVVWKTFSMINIILFSFVVVFVLNYRRKKYKEAANNNV